MPDSRGRPQCPTKACAVRYRAGPDRLCPEHAAADRDGAMTDLAQRAGVAGLMDAPGGPRVGATNALSAEG